MMAFTTVNESSTWGSGEMITRAPELRTCRHGAVGTGQGRKHLPAANCLTSRDIHSDAALAQRPAHLVLWEASAARNGPSEDQPLPEAGQFLFKPKESFPNSHTADPTATGALLPQGAPSGYVPVCCPSHVPTPLPTCSDTWTSEHIRPVI